MKAFGTRISRRRFLGGVSLAAAGTLGYARFVEAEWLQVRQHSIPLSAGVRPPLRLLHISDLHASALVSLDYINSAIERGLEFEPHLICVTGDFVTTKYENRGAYVELLSRLSNTAPAFAVLGNHDGGQWALRNEGYKSIDWINGVLTDAGIRLLQNESQAIAVNDWNLRVAGVADAWSGLFDPSPAFGFGRAAPADATILLSHNPDTKTGLAAFPWDLMLCGHTHGGQLRLPLIGTPFAPVRDKRYVLGLHRWNNRWLHITAGIGSVLGVRINCPPEVSLLTLT